MDPQPAPTHSHLIVSYALAPWPPGAATAGPADYLVTDLLIDVLAATGWTEVAPAPGEEEPPYRFRRVRGRQREDLSITPIGVEDAPHA